MDTKINSDKLSYNYWYNNVMTDDLDQLEVREKYDLYLYWRAEQSDDAIKLWNKRVNGK